MEKNGKEWKSMWTEEKLKEAAVQHLLDIGGDLYADLMGTCMPHDEMNDIEEYIKNAFLAGARFIINNTQKQ